MKTNANLQHYSVTMPNGSIGGIFHPRVETDKWGNNVTVIELPHRKYRMVHHTPANRFRQRAVLYGGRNKFARIFTSTSAKDTVATTIEVANILVSWGDGDNLGVVKFEERAKFQHGKEPQTRQEVPFADYEMPLVETLRTIRNDNFEQVILSCIYAFDATDKWQSKSEG